MDESSHENPYSSSKTESDYDYRLLKRAPSDTAG